MEDLFMKIAIGFYAVSALAFFITLLIGIDAEYEINIKRKKKYENADLVLTVISAVFVIAACVFLFMS